MRLRHPTPGVLQDRLAWQCASLLLAYPDVSRLDTAEQLLSHIEGSVAELLSRSVDELRRLEPMRLAQTYVETFDLNSRTTMYLTYWTAGDTRNRGAAMLTFKAAYRAAGVVPPAAEAPDYLPVVLEFAATVDPGRGRRLLTEHRVALDVLAAALAADCSPYAHAVGAVSATLAPVTPAEVWRAQRLAVVGPPAEAVGLQPFTLTVPRRRDTGGE